MTYQILKVKDKTDSYYVDHPLFPIPFKLAIIGKSQMSGKTTIVLNLLANSKFGFRDIFDGEDIFLITNNKLDNKLKMLAKAKEIPKSNIMEYDEDRLEVLYEMLEDDFLNSVELKEKPTPKLLVFDDVAYSGDLASRKSKQNIVNKIVMNGRHAMISSIFTSQKYSLLNTGIRTNLTGAILFATNSKEIELMESDLNFLPTKRDFINLYRETTNEGRNNFMVVNFKNPIETRYLNKNFEPIKVPSSSASVPVKSSPVAQGEQVSGSAEA